MLTILAGSRRVSALIGVIAVASSTLSATGLEACGTTESASSTPPTAAPTADCASYEPAEAHNRLVARLGDTLFPVMLSDEDAKRHNELYGAASALASDELVLHGTNEPGPPNDDVRSKLQEAIRLYKEALELDPSNFSTM